MFCLPAGYYIPTSGASAYSLRCSTATCPIAGRTIAGSADGVGSNAEFNTPWGVCTDSAGDILVADYNGNMIRRINSAGLVFFSIDDVSQFV